MMYRSDGMMNWVEKKAFARHHKHEVINAKNIDKLENEIANIGEPLTIFSEPTIIPGDYTGDDFDKFILEHGVGIYKQCYTTQDNDYTEYYIILGVDIENGSYFGFAYSFRYDNYDNVFTDCSTWVVTFPVKGEVKMNMQGNV